MWCHWKSRGEHSGLRGRSARQCESWRYSETPSDRNVSTCSWNPESQPTDSKSIECYFFFLKARANSNKIPVVSYTLSRACWAIGQGPCGHQPSGGAFGLSLWSWLTCSMKINRAALGWVIITPACPGAFWPACPASCQRPWPGN